jgi:hypothetical protein
MAAFEKLLSLIGGRAAQTRQFKNSQHILVANPWHAVAIVTSRPSCPVCGAFKGVRFLAREAPALPLRQCPDPAGCNTVYKHFPDRRAGPRRAAERRASQPMNLAVVSRTVRDDRRGSTGRRQTDGH